MEHKEQARRGSPGGMPSSFWVKMAGAAVIFFAGLGLSLWFVVIPITLWALKFFLGIDVSWFR